MCITNVGVKIFFFKSLVKVWQKKKILLRAKQRRESNFLENSFKYFRHSLSVLGTSMEKEVCMLVMRPLKLCKGNIYVYIYVHVSM